MLYNAFGAHGKDPAESIDSHKQTAVKRMSIRHLKTGGEFQGRSDPLASRIPQFYHTRTPSAVAG